MSQSVTASAVETITNVAAGFAIATALNFTVLPLFGYTPSISEGLAISAVYTVASIARGFVLRRIFNRFTHG